jgi:predicted kinase
MWWSVVVKKVWVMRGCPGCGKSHIAQQLKKEHNATIFSNDDLLTENGVHRWTKKRSAWAHGENQKLVAKAMRDGLPGIIIDNPCLRPYVAAPYIRLAQHYNYEWEVIEPKTPWAYDLDKLEEIQKNTHKVPRDQLAIYLKAWKNVNLETFLIALGWELPMDPEVNLRLATIALEEGDFFAADEHLIGYRDWRNIDGYEPEAGDELAERLENKLTKWRIETYNLRGIDAFC